MIYHVVTGPQLDIAIVRETITIMAKQVDRLRPMGWRWVFPLSLFLDLCTFEWVKARNCPQKVFPIPSDPLFLAYSVSPPGEKRGKINPNRRNLVQMAQNQVHLPTQR